MNFVCKNPGKYCRADPCHVVFDDEDPCTAAPTRCPYGLAEKENVDDLFEEFYE